MSTDVIKTTSKRGVAHLVTNLSTLGFDRESCGRGSGSVLESAGLEVMDEKKKKKTLKRELKGWGVGGASFWPVTPASDT